MANVIFKSITNSNNAIMTTVVVDNNYSLEFKTSKTPTQVEVDSYVQNYKDVKEAEKKEQEIIEKALEDRYLTLEERKLKYG